jgi:heptosyltransferase-2
MKRFLVIQTAFIGDVVLALPVVQRLHALHPGCEVHVVVRKGNEGLLENHPAVQRIWIWNKKEGKLKNLFALARELRAFAFDGVYNLHRFGSSGFLTWRMKATEKVGFDKNPWSWCFTRRVAHEIPYVQHGKAQHEVQRNLYLLEGSFTASLRPQLHPSPADEAFVGPWAQAKPYVVLAPASVWFTKQMPAERWRDLMARFPAHYTVYLVGAPGDAALADTLTSAHPRAENLCGKLTLLQTAALMRTAHRVYANDSAPMHFASAVNAPTTAFFCSTVPEFGFGPLSEDAEVIEVKGLACRPCGLHGHKKCPKGHFGCGLKMPVEQASA